MTPLGPLRASLQRLPLSLDERHTAATYRLRAAGDSVQGAGIFDGDVLVVDRSIEPLPGLIVGIARLREPLERTARRNLILPPPSSTAVTPTRTSP